LSSARTSPAGTGAALYARQHHEAVYGQGVGLQCNSYAIATIDEHPRPLPLDLIREHVATFKRFAAEHPEMRFHVTAIGRVHARTDCTDFCRRSRPTARYLRSLLGSQFPATPCTYAAKNK
jgi:hypothetical protein